MTPEFSTNTLEREGSRMTLDKSKFLAMAPHELAQYFRIVEKNGQLKTLCKNIVDDDQLLAATSWWERWLSKEQIIVLEATIADHRRQTPLETMGELPLGLEKNFSEEELQLIFSNLGALQLTQGCSVGCKFCAFDALPKAREHFPFGQIKQLFERYGSTLPKVSGKSGQHTLLFYASDPADYISTYEGVKKTFRDVYELFEQHTGQTPFVSTRKVNDPHWMEYMRKLKSNKRVSTLGLSPEKAKTVREESGGDWSHSKPKRGIGRDVAYDTSGDIGGGTGGGIGCFDGTLITPRGLYNTVQVPVSKQYPQGMIVAPIERLSGVKISPGDRLDEALRYVIAVNIPINENGTISRSEVKRIYKSGEVEFQVFIDGKKKYLIVDHDFIIKEICNDSPREQLLHRQEEEVKRAIQDAEQNPELLRDELFAEKFWRLQYRIGRTERDGRYHLSSVLWDDEWREKFNNILKPVAEIIRRMQNEGRYKYEP